MSNVNKAKRAPIYITLDKQRELRFTLNSFAEMEDQFGTVDKAMRAVQKGSLKAIRFVLYAGLLNSEDALTERQVGSYIEIPDLKSIADKLNTVLLADLPKEVPGKAKVPNHGHKGHKVKH